MKYLGDILCLEFPELVPSIMPEKSYEYHRKEENITWYVESAEGYVKGGRSGNGRQVLIEYASMPPKYRALVEEKYGNPYKYASSQPLLDAIEKDIKALEYYRGYVLPNGMKMPDSDRNVLGKAQINYVARYTRNAEWMNMISKMLGDKTALKRQLNITTMEFWDVVGDLIKVHIKKDNDTVKLPTSRIKLSKLLKEYQQDGYEELIVDKARWGNDRSKKVNEDKLKALLSARNTHDDTIIAEHYNIWAMKSGHAVIDHGTVKYWRKKWEKPLLFYREGRAKLVNELSKHIHTDRATAPLLKIESDDNDFDPYYYKPETVKTRNGKQVVVPANNWFRLAVYIVKDTFNDLPLGYAVGHTITKEVVQAAYRDANRYVRRLTGADYLWHQIETDRWGIGVKGKKTDLHEFFEAQARFTPAKAKHSRSKLIEASFGTAHHQLLKEMFPDNYSGHNIKAKENLNPDTLDPRNFPPITQAPQDLANFMDAIRCSRRKGSELTREEEWLQAFQESEKSKQRMVSPTTRLKLLGKKHNHLNELKSAGLAPTIEGNGLCYELSQQILNQHAGKKVQIYYDPADLSQVMYTDHNGLNEMASIYQKAKNAQADQTEWDRKRISTQLDEQGELMKMIEDWAPEDMALQIKQAQSEIKANRLDKVQSYRNNQLVSAASNAKHLGSTTKVIDITEGNSSANTSKATQKTTEQRGVRAEKDPLKTIKKPLKSFKQEEDSIYDRM